MSGLLLDANAFAMGLVDDPRLPAPARERLATAERVAMSAISFCEIGQKVRLGKWSERAPFAPGLVERAREDGLELLPCPRRRRWKRRFWIGITGIRSIG